MGDHIAYFIYKVIKTTDASSDYIKQAMYGAFSSEYNLKAIRIITPLGDDEDLMFVTLYSNDVHKLPSSYEVETLFKINIHFGHAHPLQEAKLKLTTNQARKICCKHKGIEKSLREDFALCNIHHIVDDDDGEKLWLCSCDEFQKAMITTLLNKKKVQRENVDESDSISEGEEDKVFADYLNAIEQIRRELTDLGEEERRAIIPISLRQPDGVCFRYEFGEVAVEAVRLGIMSQSVDAIVIPTDIELKLIGSIREFMSQKTKNRISYACESYLEENNKTEMKIGSAICTKSFMANCDYIIHAVTPRSEAFKNDKRLLYWLLEELYYYIFILAEKKIKVHTLALPVIGMETYFNINPHKSSKRFSLALKRFLYNTAKMTNRNLKRIKICCNFEYDTLGVDRFLRITKNYFDAKEIKDDLEEMARLEQLLYELESKQQKNEPTKESEIDILSNIVDNEKQEQEQKNENENSEDISRGRCTMCDKVVKIVYAINCGCQYCGECKPEFIKKGYICKCKAEATSQQTENTNISKKNS